MQSQQGFKETPNKSRRETVRWAVFYSCVWYISIGAALSLSCHTPQGQDAAQMPQPMHFSGAAA